MPCGTLRALAVLELLGARRALPASVIATRCGMPRSSAYHLLSALADEGFLAREGRLWALGPRAARVAAERPPGEDLLAVLEAFDGVDSELTTADAAARIGVDLARVEAAVEELTRLRLVEPAGRGRIRLGLRLAAISSRMAPVERLRAGARPHLVRLRDGTGETASLLVKDGGQAVYLEQVESLHAMRHTGWLGRAIPLGGTAAGLALTYPGTCQVVEDAVEVGVLAVAQAVAGTSPRAAVSVIGPTARIGGAGLTAVRTAVRRAAQAVERSLASSA